MIAHRQIRLVYYYAFSTDSRTKAGTKTETHTAADVAGETAGDAACGIRAECEGRD